MQIRRDYGATQTTARPATDVAAANPQNVVYLKGDESADGGIRLAIDVGVPEIQERKLGIWVAV